jgi:excisionase family DNA binding protein
MTIRERIEQAKMREWITVEEFALLLGYDPQTVWRKVRRGDIPGVVRHGRTIRINRAEALSTYTTPASL